MMKREADIIAKMIRNADISQDAKRHLARSIAEHLLHWNQFFNSKHFIEIATMEFPEGWPNQVEGKWKNKNG